VASVFILCAGTGDRWNNFLGVPKQLITFGSETLLQRTNRLVSVYDTHQVYCVTTNLRISISVKDTILLARSDSLAETIHKTSSFWTQRNVFLLGDVFYSDAAVSQIFGCSMDLAFLGRPWPSSLVKSGHGEMFALTFVSDRANTVRRLLDSGIAVRAAGAPGNLWNLYQLAADLPLGSCEIVPSLLVPIDDYTNDIDTPEDFKRRCELYQQICSGDAGGGSNSGTCDTTKRGKPPG
jgi:hypothetical protein